MKVLKILKMLFLSVTGFILMAMGLVYAINSYRLNRKHELSSFSKITIHDYTVIARSRHIATRYGMCTACQGGDLKGAIFLNRSSPGRITASNLTLGRGGEFEFNSADDNYQLHTFRIQTGDTVWIASMVWQNFKNAGTVPGRFLNQLP